MSSYFVVFYEDSAKLDAAIGARLVDPDAEGLHDYAQDHCVTRQRFESLDAAVKWASKRVAGKATIYGVADVREIKLVGPRARCRYCTCMGKCLVRHWHVDETGIVDEFNGSECD